MHKKLVAFRPFCALLGVLCLTFAGRPVQQTPPATPGQPMRLGVNYFAGLWHPNEQTLLGYLPLGIVRWGGDASDTSENPTGLIKRFVSDARATHNAEPLYQVPFLFGESPADEARQVQDVNITDKLGIKYWEIGNEPELFQAVMHQNVALDDYLTGWRADAKAMLAVDPTITLVGPDVSMGLAPIDKSSRAWQWFDAFIKANGDMIGVVSLHFYPYSDADQSPDAIFNNVDTFAQNLTMLRSYLHDTLKRDLPLMINETNLSAQGGGGNISDSGLYAGLWLADLLGTSAQQGVAAVMVWDAVRNGAFSLLDDSGTPRPTFYALQAYTGLGSTVDTPAGLPIGVHGYHSQADSGEAIEVLINRTAQPISISIGNTSITLGAYSFTRLHFDAAGKLMDGTTYGQAEFNAQHPPSDALHPSS